MGYQTPTNSKETHRGDHGHLGNLERHLERTMGVTMVRRNGITQIRLSSMGGGAQNGESPPRRNSNLDPPYHVYNRNSRPKIHSENIHHQRSPKGGQNIEQYFKLSDWASLLVNKDWQECRQSEPIPSTDTGRLIQNLIHETSEDTLLEELEDIKHALSQDTPLSWLIEKLTDELWKEEQFQNGDLPTQSVPGLQTV
jgi:hypothetical protein